MYRGSVNSHVGNANKQTFDVLTTSFHNRVSKRITVMKFTESSVSRQASWFE